MPSSPPSEATTPKAYFDAFSPEATFIFYNLDRTLANRGEYEAEWALWETRDGFAVRACRSTGRNVQIFGNVAIFTHAVETDLSIGGESNDQPRARDDRLRAPGRRSLGSPCTSTLSAAA